MLYITSRDDGAMHPVYGVFELDNWEERRAIALAHGSGQTFTLTNTEGNNLVVDSDILNDELWVMYRGEDRVLASGCQPFPPRPDVDVYINTSTAETRYGGVKSKTTGIDKASGFKHNGKGYFAVPKGESLSFEEWTLEDMRHVDTATRVYDDEVTEAFYAKLASDHAKAWQEACKGIIELDLYLANHAYSVAWLREWEEGFVFGKYYPEYRRRV